jgi:hypothetical protein
MAEQTPQPQSIFPDLPRDPMMVTKEGGLTQQWHLGFQSLFQALQTNFKNEGVVFPSLTIDQINDIQALYTPYIGIPLPQYTPATRGQLVLPDISGQTVFDSTNRLPKQFIITYDSSNPPNVLSAQWLILNVMLTNAGNPNGSVAGVLNWFCFDTSGHVLYICTVSGSTTSAVWVSV